MIRLLTMAATLALAAPALAQAAAPAAPAAPTAPRPPRCDGEVQLVRISTLKPGATIAQFEAVVARHMAWYRSHGYTENNQRIARLMTPTGWATDKVATIHVNAPGVPREKRDAEWDGFVKAYRDISDISNEYFLCFPGK